MHVAIFIFDGALTRMYSAAWLWLTMIAIALGPILIRQVTRRFGLDLVPPNLDQLCDCTIVFWPAMSMAMAISLVSTLMLCSKVKPGLKASMYAFIFALASSVLMSLMCCAQLFKRIVVSDSCTLLFLVDLLF